MPGFNDIFKDLLGRISAADKRLTKLESIEYVRFYPIAGASSYLINQAVVAGNLYNSGNLRGVSGIGDHAKGFLGTMWIDATIADVKVRVTPGNETPGNYSQQYRWEGGTDTDRQLMTQLLFGFLGPDGSINFNIQGTSTNLYVVAFGYWE